ADAIVADWMSHILRAESAGVAFSSAVQIEPITTRRGVFTVDELRAALDRLRTTPSPYSPRPRLVCVEQTHNFGGGAVWTLAELDDVSKLARSEGLSVHMDGARLLNAVVAKGVPAGTYAAAADSVWLDFTKGLGAPIGAVLAGSRGFIDEARRYKHVFAGAMRQAGIAAAGCLHALDHHVDRLAEDHHHARLLADGLMQIEGVRVRTPTPETNMVFFDPTATGWSNARFLTELAARGIRMGAVRGEIRAVTHLDVSRADVKAAVEAIAAIARRPPDGVQLTQPSVANY
ncbi:MAG: putative threonine aldolase, partial [Rhizobacter sp.]|nr:putative threonine aldolase [Rhizobacter sp.]